jgi:hypothetical protein
MARRGAMGKVVTLTKVSQSRRLARQASATINGMKVRGRQALSAKMEGTTMLKCFLRTKKYLLIVAICLSCCAINGCIESIWELTSDSRLPKWITLPPGLTRADVKVGLEAMEPTRRGVDIKVALVDRKYKKLAEVRGKSFDLSGRYFIDVVDGVPEIAGLTHHINEHGVDYPYFYVVDDPALKRKLLDENEQKLLDENGIDYPDLRKKLLDENGR